MAESIVERRNLGDLIGAATVGAMLTGLIALFGSIFGVGGGRYGLVLLACLPVLIFSGLWRLVGIRRIARVHCSACSFLPK